MHTLETVSRTVALCSVTSTPVQCKLTNLSHTLLLRLTSNHTESNPTNWCVVVMTLLTVKADLAACAAGPNLRLKPTHNASPQNL